MIEETPTQRQSESAKSKRHQAKKQRQAAIYRKRRIRFILGFVLLCLVVTGILITLSMTEAAKRTNAHSLDIINKSAPITMSDETNPIFALLGDRNLILPIAATDATIIAYQPINDERVVPLSPLGEHANANAFIRFFRNIFSDTPSIRYYTIKGEGGGKMSSVLIGAAPGSPVTAPVSGVVTAVKDYKLYGKYEDVRIDIQLEKLSSSTVTIMLIDNPVVTIGEVVTAGKTQLGMVRKCPVELGAVLTEYTHDSGSHIHMWVTEDSLN